MKTEIHSPATTAHTDLIEELSGFVNHRWQGSLLRNRRNTAHHVTGNPFGPVGRTHLDLSHAEDCRHCLGSKSSAHRNNSACLGTVGQHHECFENPIWIDAENFCCLDSKVRPCVAVFVLKHSVHDPEGFEASQRRSHPPIIVHAAD